MAITTTITDAARLVNRHKIDGFSTTVTMGDDDCILPGRCAVGGYEWEVCVYPARTSGSPDGKKWVALRLALLSEPRTPAVRANLCCLALHLAYITSPKKESGVFRRPKDCTPFVYLVSVSDVENSGYLSRDAFTMECTITVLNESPTSQAKEMSVPSSNLNQNLGELLQTEMGADATFLVSGEHFAAHKSILAARSPVFKAQFFGEMKDKSSPSIEVEGMEGDGLQGHASLHLHRHGARA
ncbi:Speckle-type POZ protein-like protein [Hordeum vulgare]|nr:Speckle-type POZ protein-like protein [Hordeum vulgare]